MYIKYVSNWILQVLQIRFPLVLSQDNILLVTIWDMFMLTVFLGIFIILVKYIITDTVSIKLGDTDINYSSSSYIPSRIHKDSVKLNNYINTRKDVNNRISDIQSKKRRIFERSKK